MLNKVVLIGRLTRDPEIRHIPSGAAVTTFTLAVNRNFTNQQGERETDFIRIVAWQKQAELCANYLKKGRLVAVEGRLQIRNYETQDGQKRRVAEVVANFVQFLDRNRDDNQSNSVSDIDGGMSDADDFDGINLDDLPF